MRTDVLIFSVQKATLSAAEDKRRHIEALGYLHKHNIPYHQAVGCYQGQSELSFIVPVDYADAVLYLAKAFDQECILVVGHDGKSVLIDPEGTLLERLPGRYHEVEPEVASNEEGWTYDVEEEAYYCVC